jgi:hypothetical protein
MVDTSGPAVRVVFPAAMNPGLAGLCSLGLLPIIWTAWAYLRIHAVLGACLAIAIAVPVAYGCLCAWFMRTTVSASDEALTVERSMLGWTRRYACAAKQVTGIRAVPTVETAVSAWYAITVQVGGRAMRIGSLLASRSEADHIVQLMQMRLPRAAEAPAG